MNEKSSRESGLIWLSIECNVKNMTEIVEKCQNKSNVIHCIFPIENHGKLIFFTYLIVINGNILLTICR